MCIHKACRERHYSVYSVCPESTCITAATLGCPSAFSHVTFKFRAVMRKFSHPKQGEACHHQVQLWEPQNQTQHNSPSLTQLRQHHHTVRPTKQAANGSSLEQIFTFCLNSVLTIFISCVPRVTPACGYASKKGIN